MLWPPVRASEATSARQCMSRASFEVSRTAPRAGRAVSTDSSRQELEHVARDRQSSLAKLSVLSRALPGGDGSGRLGALWAGQRGRRLGLAAFAPYARGSR